MIIVDMIIAAMVAVLAGLGIGGGGLLIIYLTMVRGTEQLCAQGINLCFFVFSAIAALCVHLRKRRIDIRRCLYIAAAGACSCIAGGYLSHRIDTDILRTLFGILMITGGVLTLIGTRGKKADKTRG